MHIMWEEFDKRRMRAGTEWGSLRPDIAEREAGDGRSRGGAHRRYRA